MVDDKKVQRKQRLTARHSRQRIVAVAKVDRKLNRSLKTYGRRPTIVQIVTLFSDQHHQNETIYSAHCSYPIRTTTIKFSILYWLEMKKLYCI